MVSMVFQGCVNGIVCSTTSRWLIECFWAIHKHYSDYVIWWFRISYQNASQRRCRAVGYLLFRVVDSEQNLILCSSLNLHRCPEHPLNPLNRTYIRVGPHPAVLTPFTWEYALPGPHRQLSNWASTKLRRRKIVPRGNEV